jgi:MFS family permease
MTFLKSPLHWVARDGKLIVIANALGRFVQSSIVIFLALYLGKLGFSLVQIGTFLSAGVAGSAFFTFLVSIIANRAGRRRLLIIFTLMSACSGLALVLFDDFLLLLFFAFLGSLSGRTNPTQPLEQASLTDTAPPEKRTDLFAIYRIVGVGSTALGALAAGLPTIYQKVFAMSEIDAYKAMFIGFAVILLLRALLYGLLSSSIDVGISEQRWTNPFRLPSRRLIFTLTGLFSLDAFAGSLVLDSLAAYWFYTKFGLELGSVATIFFFSRLIAAFSLWVAAKIANRIGLINTMVFTHIPSSLFFIAAVFAPTPWLAILFWQLRSFLGQMDQPTRDSYTMSVVGPDERVAMAGINNVGRSVSGTIAPSVSTVLWQTFSASVPFIACAVLKITYDLWLYFLFRNVKPPQEAEPPSSARR